MTDGDSKQTGKVMNPQHFGSDRQISGSEPGWGLTPWRISCALCAICTVYSYLCSRLTFNRPLLITQLGVEHCRPVMIVVMTHCIIITNNLLVILIFQRLCSSAYGALQICFMIMIMSTWMWTSAAPLVKLSVSECHIPRRNFFKEAQFNSSLSFRPSLSFLPLSPLPFLPSLPQTHIGVWGSAISAPSWVRSRAPVANTFRYFLSRWNVIGGNWFFPCEPKCCNWSDSLYIVQGAPAPVSAACGRPCLACVTVLVIGPKA